MIIRTYQRRSKSHANGLGNSAYSTGDNGCAYQDSNSQNLPWSSSQESPFLANSSSQDSAYWSQLDFGSAPDPYTSKQGGIESSFKHGRGGFSTQRPNSQPLTKRDEEAYFSNQKKKAEASLARDSASLKRAKREIEVVDLTDENGNPKLDLTDDSRSRYGPLAPPTSTLMEAQESGEMMEHFDEANFAMDGLRPGQPLRVQRASMCSILSLCGSLQQRRLLRSHGLARPLVEAVVTLPVHDAPLALSAAAVLFFLAMDGQDEELLGSPISIHFLLKLLKPESQTRLTENSSTFGAKLASMASKLNPQKVNTSSTSLDQGAASVIAKVKALFASSKERRSREGMQDPEQERFSGGELSSKWLALLTLEKACLSTVLLEDTAGAVKKTGGQFKESLREFGGLDAISDLASDCLLNLKELLASEDLKLDSRLFALQKCERSGGASMLLRCLKVMENVTFLSEDNQKHLLCMKLVKGKNQTPDSFIDLVLGSIQACHDLMHVYTWGNDVSDCLGASKQTLQDCSERKESSMEQTKARAATVKACQTSGYKSGEPNSQMSVLKSLSSQGRDERVAKVSAEQIKCESEKTLSCESHGISKVVSYKRTKTKSLADLSAISSSTKNSKWMGDPLECIAPKGTLGRFHFAQKLGSKSNRSRKSTESMELEDSQDPFAFDEDLDFEAKKQNKRASRRQKLEKSISSKIVSEAPADRVVKGRGSESQAADSISHLEDASASQESTDVLNETENSQYAPFAECVLSAVKVLMNLTNDNPDGCRQVAKCGGLDIMAMLILGYCDKQKKNSKLQTDNDSVEEVCVEEDLDLLVAVLGVLVNLIEKDDRNRARLASLNFPASTCSTTKNLNTPHRREMISLLCFLFLSKQGAGEAAEVKEGRMQLEMDGEVNFRQGQREAEDMIVEAYAALLLAFLSRDSDHVRLAISKLLPGEGLLSLVPVLERFVAFHLSLNMLSAETHAAVRCVIDSCKQPCK